MHLQDESVSKKKSAKRHKNKTKPKSSLMTPPSSKQSTSKLKAKMSKRLSGARFRWINEKLYTCSGHEAFKLFSDSPELFTVYHEGFDEQASKWPQNPLDHVIEYVKTLPESYVIADFGCGDARLARSVPQVVHSFDLVANNESVVACDMANVPLSDSSVDVCVFCLSLMNENVIDFIHEARRVLKVGGVLKICEIRSRIDSLRDFVSRIKKCSFHIKGKPDSFNKLFVSFTFVLKNKVDSSVSEITLKPCFYKKR